MTDVHLDWLEGTWLGVPQHDATEMATMIAGPLTPLEKGSRGYSHSAIIAETGRLSWSPNHPSHGVHLCLPGQALRSGAITDTDGVVRFLTTTGFRASRLDFAIDDKGGHLLDLNIIEDAVASNAMVTRIQTTGTIEKWDRATKERGRTIALGSRSAMSYMRIYDKAAEQHEPGHWIRAELELKHKRAAEALHVLDAQGPAVVAGWIRRFVDFTIPGEDTNRRRWEPAPWWQSFLAWPDKVRLVINPEPRTMETVMTWMAKSVAPSMAMLKLTQGEAYLSELADEGTTRMSPVLCGILQNWLLTNPAQSATFS